MFYLIFFLYEHNLTFVARMAKIMWALAIWLSRNWADLQGILVFWANAPRKFDLFWTLVNLFDHGLYILNSMLTNHRLSLPVSVTILTCTILLAKYKYTSENWMNYLQFHFSSFSVLFVVIEFGAPNCLFDFLILYIHLLQKQGIYLFTISMFVGNRLEYVENQKYSTFWYDL